MSSVTLPTERRAELINRLPTVQPIKQGWVYRSSDVIDNLVNKRFAAIAETFLMTYRREEDAKPSKVWSLTGATVDPIKEVECEIKAKGTSTVIAIVASRYTKKHLVCALWLD